MRVLYLLEDLGIAGGVKVVVEHAEGLAARGHDVVVATRGPRPEWIPVAVPLVKVPEFTREQLPAADVAVATWYTTVVPLAKARPAPRLFHFSQGYEGIYPHVAGFRKEIDEAYAQPIPKLLISRHLVDLFTGRFPGPFHVLPQAIRAADYAPRENRSAAGSPANIGIVGPFPALNKGVPVGVRAFQRLRGEGRAVRLHRASQLALGEDERRLASPDAYLAEASVAQMIAFYRGLDVLIHPSFEAEGFPLPPLEAMASGVPTVLTEIPSYESLPRDAASWVPPGDEAGMAREAGRLLDDPGLWRFRRARGLLTASRYSLDRVLDRLEAIFRE